MPTRRSLLALLPTLGLAPLAGRAIAADEQPQSAVARAPYRTPAFELVYECDVTLSGIVDFGKTIEGTRRIIPITGGHFSGPTMRGTVMEGGADWNLQRSDGAGSVEAAYYLKTDDGVILRITNKGVGSAGGRSNDPDEAEHFFMFTTPSFEAPAGKYDWLNCATFVGTLGARKGAKDAVLIRVFKVV